MNALDRMLENKPTIVIVGGAFGDEGKGKAVSGFAGRYDIHARYSGGGNAGHTVFTADGRKLVGHLLPCGLAAGKICVVGRGVLVELGGPNGLIHEIKQARQVLGTQLPPIWVDEQCVLWTPWHPLLESYLESLRGECRINTTGRGIGPMMALQKLRLGVLLGEMFDETRFRLRLEEMFNSLEPIFGEMLNRGDIKTNQVPTVSDVAEQLLGLRGAVLPLVRDTSVFLHKAISDGQRVLAEGAQATGLDSMWGTYPFVSSTMSTAAGASLGLGLPPSTFPHVLLVTKVLPTRVGAGPFPSEIWDRDAAQHFPQSHPQLFQPGSARDDHLRIYLDAINSDRATAQQISTYFQVLGDERGATTGRGRSVGWLDIPLLQYACRLNGPFGIALMRFDMLSGLKKIPVVVGYQLDGQIQEPGAMPPPWQLPDVKPIIERWDGWDEDIAGVKYVGDLPAKAVKFLTQLDDYFPCPVRLIGTGPKEDEMTVRAV